MVWHRGMLIVPVSAMILAALLWNRPYVFAALAAALVPLLLWDRIRRTKALRASPRRTGYRIKVRDIRSDSLVSAFRPVLDMPFFRGIQDRIEQRIKPDILRSGSVENPRLLGIRSVLYPVAAGAVMVPAGVVLTVLYGWAFLGVVFAPMLLTGAYFATLRARASERSSAVTDELAAFAILASIMESVNVSLYSTLVMIADSPAGIFAVMSREGRRIRNMAALGRSPTEALLELSESHPNQSFRDFVDGYVSSFNTGGSDTARYLQDQAGRFFRDLQFRMNAYAKHADMIAQIVLTVMMLLPMMGLSMMFFSTGQVASMMMVVLTAVFPFMTVVLVGVIQAKQPKGADAVRVQWWVFPAGAAAAIPAWIALGSIWEAVGVGVVASSFCNALLTRKRFREAQAVEGAMPEFMRQVTRLRNIGFDITYAIREIRDDITGRRRQSSSAKFNRTFDEIIVSVHKAVSAGNPLGHAVARMSIPSRSARLIFFILGKVNESGGGTAKTINEITRWVTQHHDARKEMVSSLRASFITAFVGPALMVMMMSVSDQLAAKLEENYDRVSDLGGLPVSLAASDITGMSEVLVVIASACMGVVLSKINYFTVRHTAFTGAITAATMALLYAVPYFPEFGF